METNTRDDTDGTLEVEHEHMRDTVGRPGLRSHKPWSMGITGFRLPNIDQGMMDDTQDLTKMHEQMHGVTSERHVHKPSSNDQHDQEKLMMINSTTGATQEHLRT